MCGRALLCFPWPRILCDPLGIRNDLHPDTPYTHLMIAGPRSWSRQRPHDGSRGFQPTGINACYVFRRGASVDAAVSRGVAHGFMRRAATRVVVGAVVRGLKPTATITMSLRDKESVSRRGATVDGSRGFQPAIDTPGLPPYNNAREEMPYLWNRESSTGLRTPYPGGGL